MKREVTNLRLDWKFHLGEVVEGGYKGLDDTGWQTVTLPHDWSVEHPFDKAHSSGTGYLAGGIGWYRRAFTLPADLGQRRVLVTFDGVYKHARVYCNSNYLGMRAFGYSSFTYDITPFVSAGHNVLAVRAEHTDLADSRWFTGNGIYRDVRLNVVNPLHFVEHGVFVSTVAAEGASATLRLQWALSRAGKAAFSLVDAQDREVARTDAQGEAGETCLTVPRPSLWSPEHPTLYTLRCTADDGADVQDQVEIPVGIRTFSFDVNQGFVCNGVPYKLKGVCIHHDAGALGSAVPKNVWERRLRKLQQAGCNAIRTSHNPPDPHLLDLCDEMGFFVMDEAFDEWEGCKNKWWQGHNVYPPKRYGYADDFPMWHEQDLADMVRRDRNHPSIILWSIGNEIDYPNDPYVHPTFESMTGNNDANKPAAERQYDANKPNAQRLATVAQHLVEITKRHDTTRPVTSALAFPELSNLTGYAQALDVVGYNYKEHLYAEDHAKYPNHVIYGSENGTHADAWLAVKHNDYICGQFLWTGLDFLGEAHGWPIRMSAAGILNAAGFEKSLYALRQALWLDTPVARLAVSSSGEIRVERFGWHGEPGQTLVVSCYTNCPQATLLLNGAAIGTQQVDEKCRVQWHVTYAPGTLEVLCTAQDGTEVRDALTTAGPVTGLTMTPSAKHLPADGWTVCQVEVSLVDAQGQCPVYADQTITYSVVGDAQILGIENGDIADLTSYTSHARSTHVGKSVLFLRAGRTAGNITLYARGAGFVEELKLTQGQ